MIPATLSDADLTTILDGSASERMELVARIRGPPGLCPQGIIVHVGSDEDYIECLSVNECPYAASSDGPHPLCTREAAALAATEQHQHDIPSPLEIKKDYEDYVTSRCPPLTEDPAEAAEESGRLK